MRQLSQSAVTCSKLTLETLEHGVKYFTPCSSVFIVNFEQVNADWVVSLTRKESHRVSRNQESRLYIFFFYFLYFNLALQ